MSQPIELSILTEVLSTAAPDIEAVDDGTSVGFFRFKQGPYKGVVYTYANVGFKEVNDQLEVSFTYIIMQDPDGVQPKNAAEELVFKETLGGILVEIIEASVDLHDEKEGKNA